MQEINWRIFKDREVNDALGRVFPMQSAMDKTEAVGFLLAVWTAMLDLFDAHIVTAFRARLLGVLPDVNTATSETPFVDAGAVFVGLVGKQPPT